MDTYTWFMTTTIGNEAIKPNPELKPLNVLVGEWKTLGSHPYLPGKVLSGRASFEWIEGGAFLLWRSELNEPEFPSGVAVFGSDNATGEFFMLYFDERNVSRRYDVSVEANLIIWQRLAPDLSQRMVLTLAADGNTIASKGEMKRSGETWGPDLELTYSRVS